MLRLVGARLAQGVAVLALVATLAFVLIQVAPGDPFSAAFENPNVTEAIRAHWRAKLGLDRPILEQYLLYLASLAQGDLGYSFSQQRPVSAVLADAIPNTLLLTGTALLASFALGIALGAWQAARRGSRADRAAGTGTLVVAALPDFWLAIVLMLTFAYRLRLFPIGGMTDPVMYDYMSTAGKLADCAHHLVLPALTLTLLLTAGIARFQRAAMLEVLPDDFVRTARAKGVPERRVVFRHALRNALLPVVTLLGLALPALLGGAVFVENVFAWPGMGRVMLTAISMRDHPLVVASVVAGAALVVAGGIVADLLAAAADPRLRDRA